MTWTGVMYTCQTLSKNCPIFFSISELFYFGFLFVLERNWRKEKQCGAHHYRLLSSVLSLSVDADGVHGRHLAPLRRQAPGEQSGGL